MTRATNTRMDPKALAALSKFLSFVLLLSKTTGEEPSRGLVTKDQRSPERIPVECTYV